MRRPAKWFLWIALALLIAHTGNVMLGKHVRTAPDGSTVVDSDVICYVLAAERLVTGQDIYARDHGLRSHYVYPPFYAFLNVPLVVVPHRALDIGWFLLGVAAIVSILGLAYQVFTGRRFALLPGRTRVFYITLAILLSARYLARSLEDGNVSIPLLWLIVFGFNRLVVTGRATWAALIGVAAAIKIMPLLFVPYLVARRQYRPAVWLLASFAVCLAAPALLVGPAQNFEWMREMSTFARDQFSPAGLSRENYSFWGFLGRFMTASPFAAMPDGTPVYTNIANLSVAAIRGVIYALNVVFVAMVFFVSRWESRRSAPAAPGLDHAAFVVTLLAMNFVSVLTEEHHVVGFLVAYLYLLIAWRDGFVSKRAFVGLVFGSGLLSLFTTHDVFVPLFGKFALLASQSLTLPILPISVLLTALLLVTSRRAQTAGGCMPAGTNLPRPTH